LKLTEDFILKNWEEDWMEDRYFTHTPDGDSIGYDFQNETFSLNNYWNEIDHEEVERLLKL
jgi:hypothetical protein